mgnify:CR=1 FL=1
MNWNAALKCCITSWSEVSESGMFLHRKWLYISSGRDLIVSVKTWVTPIWLSVGLSEAQYQFPIDKYGKTYALRWLAERKGCSNVRALVQVAFGIRSASSIETHSTLCLPLAFSFCSILISKKANVKEIQQRALAGPQLLQSVPTAMNWDSDINFARGGPAVAKPDDPNLVDSWKFITSRGRSRMERRPKRSKDEKAKRKIRKNAHSSKSAYEAAESEGLMSLPLEVLHLIIDVLDHDFPALWTLRCVCHTFHGLINSFPVLGKNTPISSLMFPSVTAFNNQNGEHTKGNWCKRHLWASGWKKD